MTRVITLLSVALLGFVAVLAFPDRAVYKSSDGRKEETTVVRADGGYSVRSTSDSGLTTEADLDSSFATVSWKLVNGPEKTQVVATRSGDRIALDGTFKGKAFQKTYSIDPAPWVEDWGLGLRAFARGSEKQTAFWSINPADLTMIARFEATRVGRESLTVNGSAVECVHVKVALPGMLSVFFSMDMWYRASDAAPLRSRAPRGPGAPVVITDLVSLEE